MKNALLAALQKRIEKDGPLSLEDYMDAALGDPAHGYYVTRDPLGLSGDFITAPEVSQMFGEIAGLWAAHMWDVLGTPDAFRFIELGPGRGTLMADMLRAARLVPGFNEAAHVDLVETSPVLRARQEKTLDDVPRIAWHREIAAVPDGPAIIVANEFFDALAIRQYQRGEDGWRERLVDIGSDGVLKWSLAEKAGAVRRAQHLDAVPGDIVEISPAREAAAAAIGTRLAKAPGVALIIDYGFMGPATGDTLQAVRGHDYADPLANPGEADLTSHVDFTSLMEAARAEGARAYQPVTQGTFLASLGIAARAENLKGAQPGLAGDIDAALGRLIGPDEMGTLFKVLALTSPGLPAPPPFAPGAH